MEKDGLKRPVKLIVIGGSAGSLDVLLPAFPRFADAGMPPLVIVLHRRGGEDSALIDLFASRTRIPVKEAAEKEKIAAGTIYIAPPDYHLLIEKDLTFSLDYSEKVNHSRPAIDVTFQTAIDACRNELALILLSGASEDGADGMEAGAAAGAILAVQHPETAEVSYMPEQALRRTPVEILFDGKELAEVVNRIAAG